MNKHTPGPWKVCPVFADLNIGIVAGSDQWLLNVTGKDIVIAEANARLIAAAPEMYELLVEVKETTTDRYRYDKIRDLLTRIENPAPGR